ncbi:hypothetical protein ES703_08153 [subsurface metagenome]
MKHKLSKRFRSIVGILLTLGVFAFILLALNSWLGWPTSLLTLAGMLGIAWFVSMFAGEQLTPPGLGTTAASCLAVALAVSIIGFGVPWRLGEEDVRFDYRAMFIYLGSENNESLDNLYLRFPAPQVENEFAGEIFGSWELYYVEDDNTLTLQSTSAGIVNLRGARGSQLGIYTSIMENCEYGPTLTWNLDRLYPREVFMDRGWVWVLEKNVDKVTLLIYGESWSGAYWYTPKFYGENKGINLSFGVGLYRENVSVEQFEATWETEYGLYGWYMLTRTI